MTLSYQIPANGPCPQCCGHGPCVYPFPGTITLVATGFSDPRNVTLNGTFVMTKIPGSIANYQSATTSSGQSWLYVGAGDLSANGPLGQAWNGHFNECANVVIGGQPVKLFFPGPNVFTRIQGGGFDGSNTQTITP